MDADEEPANTRQATRDPAVASGEIVGSITHDGPPAAQTSPKAARGPALIVTIVVSAIAGLSMWYLVQPQPLIIQGEADATRIDIAARVDGKVGRRPVERGENVSAGQLLFQIDNPELFTQLREAEAGLAVASAQLANIEAGTRQEVLAQRKAALQSAVANLTLAQQTYDRTKELTGSGNASIQRLDEVTNSLEVARHSMEQAKFADQEAVNGYTPQEHGIARAAVAKAQASIDTIKAEVDELTVRESWLGLFGQLSPAG
ncbi:HlyD family secretion protein [Labrys monachus]|uniref:Multidrug resistance efflux pump n=1 Tax=Labrys monachus TaxID=217067 RepID=A0ABU0F8D4_9HYPH|nr:biotin/lipoyl-binding protein [Labrys monachus]MDQ0390879.1 multidrug resistance efflux pump [Labrys monachus]